MILYCSQNCYQRKQQGFHSSLLTMIHLSHICIIFISLFFQFYFIINPVGTLNAACNPSYSVSFQNFKAKINSQELERKQGAYTVCLEVLSVRTDSHKPPHNLVKTKTARAWLVWILSGTHVVETFWWQLKSTALCPEWPNAIQKDTKSSRHY